jgi:hypothetical protein
MINMCWRYSSVVEGRKERKGRNKGREEGMHKGMKVRK